MRIRGWWLARSTRTEFDKSSNNVGKNSQQIDMIVFGRLFHRICWESAGRVPSAFTFVLPIYSHDKFDRLLAISTAPLAPMLFRSNFIVAGTDSQPGQASDTG